MIDPDLPVQYVPMNESREWNLSDILEVPSGREAWIFDEQTVTGRAGQHATSSYVDRDTIRFQGAQDYRGPAAINFTVTDGASVDDPKGNVAHPAAEHRGRRSRLPGHAARVHDSDRPGGGRRDRDPRPAASRPRIRTRRSCRRSATPTCRDPAPALTASLNGSQLSLTTPRTTPKGSTFTVPVTLRWDKFTVQGTINVLVVGSTRPPAVAVERHPTRPSAATGRSQPVRSPTTRTPTRARVSRCASSSAEVQNTGEPAGLTFTADSVQASPLIHR